MHASPPRSTLDVDSDSLSHQGDKEQDPLEEERHLTLRSYAVVAPRRVSGAMIGSAQRSTEYRANMCMRENEGVQGW